MDAVQEIKSRLNIEDVVSEYVQLKRAGRNFKGLSPFTNEKTASFIVSPEKQIWHDFSSGKGGDVISFVETVEGLDFKGALELLARKAGVDLKVFSSGKSVNSGKKERLFKAVESAVHFYQIQLTKNHKSLKYLREDRKFDKQTLLDFQFGYSPSGSTLLLGHLLKSGFTEDEALAAGLCVRRQDRVIDMFRNRVMIPLKDNQGRPVGFTARQMSNDKNSPKYINTPATILYDKSRQLFGFSSAKEHIRKSGYVVVVEGNLDVVASHQAGIKQVVASAGTALTSHHLKSLQRFTADVRLAFDDDRAGQEAAERSIPLAQKVGVELSFIDIPTGKDPDELIKQNVDLWLKTVEKPQYMVDWLIDRVSESVDIATAHGKRVFTTKTLDIVKGLQDKVEQEHYLRIIADKSNTSVDTISKKFSSETNKTPKRLKRPQNVLNKEDKTEDTEQIVREQHYLCIMLSVNDLRKTLPFMPKELFSEQARTFLKNSDNLKDVKKEDEYVKMLTLLFEETYQHTEHEELGYQVSQLVRRLVEFYTRKEKTVILKELNEATEEQEKKLLGKVNALELLKKRLLGL